MRWILVATLAAGCSFQPRLGGDPTDTTPDASAEPDAAATTEPPPAPAACLGDPSYQVLDGSAHTYKLTALGFDFDTAFDTCAADGAHLAAVHDAAENQLVSDHAKDAWIGLDDLRTEGGFHWADGTALDFTAWSSGEPNDAGGNEDCAYMKSSGTNWNDTPCSESRKALCECEAGYRPPARPACRTMPGASIQNGRRYFVRSVAVTWTAARDDCASIGAYLMVPSDDTENALVEHGDKLNLGADGWLGLARDPAVAEQWDWVNGAPYVYTRWSTSEPHLGNGLACVIVHQTDDQWQNVACATPHPYVCECDPGEP